MKVVYNGCKYSVKKFKWSECNGLLQVIRKDGSLVIDAFITESQRYTVSTFNRIILRDEVIPTMRLYLNAQRIRKTLADAPVMVIRPTD